MAIRRVLMRWCFLLLVATVTLGEPAMSEEPIQDPEEIYLRFCANCHEPGPDKDGFWYPDLRRVVEDTEPEDLVRVIDQGRFPRAGGSHSQADGKHVIPFMPSWSWLTDRELASLVNFLKQRMGDQTVSISASEVRALRGADSGPTLSANERQAAHEIYLNHCAGCHGTHREGVVGPPLSRWPEGAVSMEEIRATLHYGTLNGMPEWGVTVRLTAHQMTLLARYLNEPAIAETATFDLAAMRGTWQPPGAALTVNNRQAADYILTLQHDARKVVLVDTRHKKIAAEIDINLTPFDVLQDDAVFVLTREGWIIQIDPVLGKERARVRRGLRANRHGCCDARCHGRWQATACPGRHHGFAAGRQFLRSGNARTGAPSQHRKCDGSAAEF